MQAISLTDAKQALLDKGFKKESLKQEFICYRETYIKGKNIITLHFKRKKDGEKYLGQTSNCYASIIRWNSNKILVHYLNID
jgi:hypothetical protein